MSGGTRPPQANGSIRSHIRLTYASECLLITVTTPDVKSFRQSDGQIMQQFEHNLKRSIGRVGTRLAEDDPTRRVK